MILVYSSIFWIYSSDFDSSLMLHWFRQILTDLDTWRVLGFPGFRVWLRSTQAAWRRARRRRLGAEPGGELGDLPELTKLSLQDRESPKVSESPDCDKVATSIDIYRHLTIRVIFNRVSIAKGHKHAELLWIITCMNPCEFVMKFV